MLTCERMKVGQVLFCGNCGLELKVVGECAEECVKDLHECCCDEGCTFTCCGEELGVKEPSASA